MPRRQLGPKGKPANYEALVQRLSQELHGGGETPMPYILEEQESVTGNVHVLVIWDDWTSLAQQQRSAVILDAYEATEGREAAMNISVAMGSTW